LINSKTIAGGGSNEVERKRNSSARKGTERLDSEILEVETPEEIADELAQIFKEAD
jgi:hypothetical protein